MRRLHGFSHDTHQMLTESVQVGFACATLLLTKGVHPKIVSEMLGHSSVSITLNVYSHVIPGLGNAAALAMDAALED